MPQLLGKKLRQVRRSRGVTQVELAQRLGVASQSHIAKVEAGEDAPSLGLVVRAAEFLQVSTDYLLRDALALDTTPAPPHLTPTESVSFGVRLRRLRSERGLSQTDLAQRLGLASQAYISGLEIEPHKLPSLDLVVRIADIFGVTTDDLLWGTGARKGTD